MGAMPTLVVGMREGVGKRPPAPSREDNRLRQSRNSWILGSVKSRSRWSELKAATRLADIVTTETPLAGSGSQNGHIICRNW